jgi:transposase InsO family protein
LAAEKEVTITAVCRQLGYSKQAYYKSLHNRTLHSFYEEMVKDKVLAIRRQMPRLGVRKLYHILQEELSREKLTIGRDKLFSLLRQEGLLVMRKKKYTKTTNSRHWMRKYPNMVKGVEVRRPEQVWVADITYVDVGKGHCFVHLVTDAYSKKIVGYKVSSDMLSSSTLAALQDAIRSRQYKHRLIHHSDRGLQYCSSAYIKALKSNGILISMTENGSPYDNAVAERINGILKDEFGLDETFETIEQAELQTRQAIKIYNQRRPHMSCSMLTPNEMHQQDILKPKAWHKKAQGL